MEFKTEFKKSSMPIMVGVASPNTAAIQGWFTASSVARGVDL